jgi:UDP-N-acetylmuramate dehydrogenase
MQNPQPQPNNVPKKWANLPLIRGVYKYDEPLDAYTTFRIGGPAEVLCEPQDLDDFCAFLRGKPQDVGLTIIGDGSNILVRDGGISGVVVRLAKGCDSVSVEGNKIRAQAGASTGKVARAAREAELTNLEWICGIPGSIGGALVMNAGCYGWEMVDVLDEITLIDPRGTQHIVAPQDVAPRYRGTTIPEGWYYGGCVFRLEKGHKDEIRERMREVNTKRRLSQPLELPNAGSLFKNPDGHKAWQLIEKAGCRGLRRGDAQVSEKHCNFFVNLGKATAADMEDLAEEVRSRVLATTGVTLEWEVRRLGERLKSW